MKKLFVLLSGLMILSMIFGACAPQTVEVIKTVTVEKIVDRDCRGCRDARGQRSDQDRRRQPLPAGSKASWKSSTGGQPPVSAKLQMRCLLL